MANLTDFIGGTAATKFPFYTQNGATVTSNSITITSNTIAFYKQNGASVVYSPIAAN